MKIRRSIYLALVLLMCITLLPALVFAADVTLTADKAVYTPNETINITVTGHAEAAEEDRGAFVSLAKANDRPENYGSPWIYVRNLSSTNGVWSFKAPTTAGEYEIRFYNKDGDYASSLTLQIPIKIAYTSDQVIEITNDRDFYTPNEDMNITVAGFTEAMESAGAFVSIAKANDRPENYGTPYKYIKDLYISKYTWTVAAPTAVGEYEIRFYSADRDYANTLAHSVPLSVVYNTGVISVTPDKDFALPGESVNVTVTGVTAPQESVNAFVSLAKKNDRPENYGYPWKYVKDLSITSGVWTFSAPSALGEYEIRLYAQEDRAYPAEVIAATANLTVTDNPAMTGGTEAVFRAEAIASGIKLSWDAVPGAIGYRIYRSSVQGEEGVSITESMITGTSFVDVNVDAKTTYYYTLRAVTGDGGGETLSSPSAAVVATTTDEVLGGNVSDLTEGEQKNLILMKLDDPNMSLNGVDQEIDPGRGTAPIVVNGRTMVPIRAIIEAMEGTVGWDDGEQKITLDAAGHSVEMWLNRTDLIVDGTAKEMDIAPSTINDRTMVPVRFAAENVGCTVDWIGSTSEIVVVFITRN